ncbi:hypothetical protein F3Y22_tig00113725pilonHSYRG00085 [Hibiscus syriacus]|uniref:Uncharacterized protein n=1 Tax=Hibiscus syriacus TaxID=106335 RepID=A0A6A2WMZ9_HIBSY|nr:hypothetical protein F3Y22_tig00113725pilonHSYRG00085 [Hibiscus syriacus]
MVTFDFTTRFGMMPAQFKAFWTQPVSMEHKPAELFYSPRNQTAITQLVNHGMVFVPIGYTFGVGMFDMEQVKGGSPYSARTLVGMARDNH